MDGPARKVRKSLVLDPWEKDCLNVQLFQEQLNNAQVHQCEELVWAWARNKITSQTNPATSLKKMNVKHNLFSQELKPKLL